jgi:hypothetical protein
MKQSELSGESAARLLNGREVLFVRLVIETAKWRLLRDEGYGKHDALTASKRGIVRGMALALTKMFGNGYEPYWSGEVKQCEAVANAMARQWVKDGSPEDDEYWEQYRHDFWRSSSDAASPDQRELRRRSYRA